MSFFRFFRKPKATPPSVSRPKPQTQDQASNEITTASSGGADPALEMLSKTSETIARRHFHNENNFQCFTTWFSHWGGWISAGHCVTEAKNHVPDFTSGGEVVQWPNGLDAALVGCTLPDTRPADPVIGQDVLIQGYPAGSRHLEQRTGRIYFERMRGQWIAHIFEPDEPVVTGMSGGPVLDAQTMKPIGITITRNSPADLNNDRDPDESADFIALSAVWDAVRAPKLS